MSEQREIPNEALAHIAEHKGFKIYLIGGVYEAYRSGRRVVVGNRIDKHTKELVPVTKATKIERVVLPGNCIEDAISGLDHYIGKKSERGTVYQPPKDHPKLF